MVKNKARALTSSDEGLRPLGEHLAIELLAVERYLAGTAMLMAGIGIAIAIFIIVFVGRPIGLAILAITTSAFVWFALARRLVDGGVGARFFSVASPLVEISVPTMLIAVDVWIQTPQYAATMSAPLQLYGILVMLQVVRLEPVMPIVVGVVGAAQYLVMYFLFVLPKLSPELAAQPEYDAPLVIVRAALVILASIAASAVGSGLRGAVQRAARSARAQDLFGRYRLQAQIAEGGMGTIHRALYCPEGGFARPVALKRIHEHLVRQPAFVDAFRGEAEISSRLVHTNIVQVLDFGRVGDTYFLAMEYVDGPNLAQLIVGTATTDRSIPPALLSRIGIEMLEGLHFAHDVARDADGRLLRVLHRDLSPGNVLVSRTGEVRITDFGIARPLGESGALYTEHVAGKSAYMSPEQARGDMLDTRSDLFAAAIVLWECITLRPLFWRGGTVASVVAVTQEEAPPPSAFRQVPASWDAFFARALAKDAARRFAHAREMQAAWRAAVGEPARAEELAAFIARQPLDEAGRHTWSESVNMLGTRTMVRSETTILT